MAGMGWDLIGHTWAAEMLRQHIAANRMRHAYLFSGPRGVGRRSLALNFAQAINCPTPTAPGVPCGTCRVCEQTARMQQADLTIIQSEAEGESLKVDQVRDLLPTSASRCELRRLRTLPLDELSQALIEKKSLESEKAELIAHISGGRPGYALRLAEDETLLAARQEWLGG